MITKKKTPAQDYAERMITALDELLVDTSNVEWQDEILTFILERPKTLRSALSAYLHQLQMKSIANNTNHVCYSIF